VLEEGPDNVLKLNVTGVLAFNAVEKAPNASELIAIADVT
jgi:hypothetical protein